MHDEDYFGYMLGVENAFHLGVASSDVVCSVLEVALDQTLNDVEENAVSVGR